MGDLIEKASWSIEERLRALDLVAEGMSEEDARAVILGGK